MKALCGLCLVALALSSCGGKSSSNSAAVEKTTARSSAKLDLDSPALGPDGEISPRVSCGAGTIWLPLKWGRPPSGTEELVLYFGRLREAGEDSPKGGVSFAAMITGISPELRGMAANTFPAGSEYRYFVSIENCPPAREGQRFLVELFALDHPRAIPADDDFAIRLAEEALGSGQLATASEAAAEFRAEALATGRFVAVYAPVESE